MQKSVIVQAGILTIIVFTIGILVGIWLDNLRLEEIEKRITEIDIDWNDARLQNMYYQAFMNSMDCDSAISANLEFADRIYQEGLKIERYEEVNRFTPSLVLEKKRYVLLQLQFWMNSINLRKLCNANYSTLLYFYSHYDESKFVQQDLQSAVLIELIHKCGPKLIAVPLPIDMDIATIEIIKSQYNIKSAPSLLINEDILLEGLRGESEINSYTGC